VIHRAVIQRVNLVLAQTKLPFSVWLRQMFETHASSVRVPSTA